MGYKINEVRATSKNGNWNKGALCKLYPLTINNSLDLTELLLSTSVVLSDFKQDWRCNENFKSTHFLVYDLDHKVDCDALISRLQDFKFLLLGTQSFYAKGRCRLIFMLDEPIFSIDHYKFVSDHYNDLFNLKSAPESRSPTQYWFKHVKVIDDNLNESKSIRSMKLEFIRENNTLEMGKVKQRKDIGNQDKALATSCLNSFKSKSKYYKVLTEGGLTRDGERNQNLLKIVGSMKAFGLPPNEAESLIAEYSTWGDRFNLERVKEVIQDIYKS